ncbi:hypothetical protein SAMN04488132_104227 [Sediminibacterium ginsengisoli]|uniref:Holliday junction resolvase RuvC n=1 Tax=Sediminibacterium ginsengisoli TaxID=413434 RepID=A0A1T4NEV3_9BACT|nr:hypothetical protein SAMN04488132_104227 [Sediminibacterium ginsengisoli]
MRVLGISIGTRRNGFAVIADNVLEVAHVRSRRDRWSPKKLQSLLTLYTRYIRRHHITNIVVKTPKHSHFTAALKQLIKALETYAKERGCLVQLTTIEHIKSQEPSIKNRNHLREFVVATYPKLVDKKDKDIKNRQPYYMKMFEATIVAHLESSRARTE